MNNAIALVSWQCLVGAMLNSPEPAAVTEGVDPAEVS